MVGWDDDEIDILEKQTAIPGILCKAGTTQARAGSCGKEDA